jgi:hypothetical protein
MLYRIFLWKSQAHLGFLRLPGSIQLIDGIREAGRGKIRAMVGATCGNNGPKVRLVFGRQVLTEEEAVVLYLSFAGLLSSNRFQRF